MPGWKKHQQINLMAHWLYRPVFWNRTYRAAEIQMFADPKIFPFINLQKKVLQTTADPTKLKKHITYQIMLNELLPKLKRWWGAVRQVLEFCLELHILKKFNNNTQKKHGDINGGSYLSQNWQKHLHQCWVTGKVAPSHVYMMIFTNWIIHRHKVKSGPGKQ